uniref:Uncharacterized protein n=1 Tax=Rangifer tarandus platyrhynchus TaxID=3082113 RepID=A0ACB0FI60_RANTA|nr:unnamed protein product [Rangifer tarandus platyrhynchus]
MTKGAVRSARSQPQDTTAGVGEAPAETCGRRGPHSCAVTPGRAAHPLPPWPPASQVPAGQDEAGLWPGRPARPPPGPGGRDQPVTPALGAVMVRWWRRRRRRRRRAGRAPTAGTRPLASRGSGGARHPVGSGRLDAARGELAEEAALRLVASGERGYQQVPSPWLPPARPPSGNSWALLCQLLPGSPASSPGAPCGLGTGTRGATADTRAGPVRACACGLGLLDGVSEDAGESPPLVWSCYIMRTSVAFIASKHVNIFS